jgi:hypothetical protein
MAVPGKTSAALNGLAESHQEHSTSPPTAINFVIHLNTPYNDPRDSTNSMFREIGMSMSSDLSRAILPGARCKK